MISGNNELDHLMRVDKLLEKVNLPEDVRHSLETLANSMRDIKPHEQPPTELVPWILSQFPLTEDTKQEGVMLLLTLLQSSASS